MRAESSHAYLQKYLNSNICNPRVKFLVIFHSGGMLQGAKEGKCTQNQSKLPIDRL